MIFYEKNLINVSQKKIISKYLSFADTPFKQIRGLIGHRPLTDTEALIFSFTSQGFFSKKYLAIIIVLSFLLGYLSPIFLSIIPVAFGLYYFSWKAKRFPAMWMLGVSYPIDIIFLDKNKQVIDIQNAIPVTLNPATWKIYKPKQPADYVIEIRSSKKSIKVGDKLCWD